MHPFMGIYLLPLKHQAGGGGGEQCGVRSIKMANILAITLLGICPKEIIRDVHRDLCARMCLTELFVIVKYWKASMCPTMGAW